MLFHGGSDRVETRDDAVNAHCLDDNAHCVDGGVSHRVQRFPHHSCFQTQNRGEVASSFSPPQVADCGLSRHARMEREKIHTQGHTRQHGRTTAPYQQTCRTRADAQHGGSAASFLLLRTCVGSRRKNMFGERARSLVLVLLRCVGLRCTQQLVHRRPDGRVCRTLHRAAARWICVFIGFSQPMNKVD